MYTRGSVIGEATIRDPEISLTPPLFLQGGVKKCEIWHRFQHRSTLSGPRLKTQHDI